jgi:hypothetical protein
MQHNELDHDAEGLDQVAARLRAERPRLTGIELDAIQRRARRHRAGGAARQSGGFMRSRIAILTMLVAGLLFSTTGASLAVTGFTADDQASVAQYGGGDDNDVAGEHGSGGGGNEVAGAEDTSPDVQPAEQAQFSSGQSDGQLPFTGFAAIPVLLIGVALLGAGLVLRRRGTA